MKNKLNHRTKHFIREKQLCWWWSCKVGSFKRPSLCLFVSATCVLSYPFGLSSVVRPSPQGGDGYAENVGLMVCLSPTRYLDLDALPEHLGLMAPIPVLGLGCSTWALQWCLEMDKKSGPRLLWVLIHQWKLELKNMRRLCNIFFIFYHNYFYYITF